MRTANDSVPGLVLGPVLRHVGHHEATVWVETERPAEVEVLGHRDRTFCVAGHHYALLTIEGLAPGTETIYEVRVDGDRVWPVAGAAPSTIRTIDDGRPLRLLAGSCRQDAPQDPDWNTHRSDGQALGPDALWAYARRARSGDLPLPDLMLHVGDQVYADEQNTAVESVLDRRRGRPPRDGWPQVASFIEYTWLYEESWSDPLVRWFLSTVPSAMIFDDHDIIDDWNTSESWRDDIRHEPWWHGRITGGLMAYWLYQHLGNAEVMEDHDRELLARVRAEPDGVEVLRAWADRADLGTPLTNGHRWSYRRDLGGVRLLVVDSRNGRQLGRGQRSMLDEAEWDWLDRQATGGVDHLVIATSLPWLLPEPIHALEAWNERVVDGAWGRGRVAWGERVRRAVDLEHWAAFGESFERLAAIVRSVAAGERGAPPASVTVVSGDVHFSYVADADLGEGPASRVHQVVTSPMRQATPLKELTAQRLLLRPPLSLLPPVLRRAAGGRRPSFGWDLVQGPDFENGVVLLTFDPAHAVLEVFRAEVGDDGAAVLRGGPQRML